MGFAVWLDPEHGVVWAQGTHEYRPMGTAAVASTDRFRPRDFRATKRRPRELSNSFVGFFGSLEEVNAHIHTLPARTRRATPAHLL